MNNNLQLAIKASIKAGEAIMQVYETSFDVEIKEDKSPLTEADKNANDVINSFLKETKIPIMAITTKSSMRVNWFLRIKKHPIYNEKYMRMFFRNQYFVNF